MPPKKTSKKRKTSATKHANGSAEHDTLPPSAPDRHEPVIRKTFKQKLPVRIGEALVSEKADKLAKTIHERNAVRLQRREANAQFREQLAYFDEMLESLATDVELHTESREVDCVERLTAQNEIETVRLDTGEILSTRTAEAKDLQEDLLQRVNDGDDVPWKEGANPAPRLDDQGATQDAE